MRVTQKGQVTIPIEVRRALGIKPGSEVDFVSTDEGVRLVLSGSEAAREVAKMAGAGDGEMTTDEILALMRR